MIETTTQPPPIVSGAVNLSAPQPVAGTNAPMTANVMESGGETSSSSGSFFSNINWVQVGFMVLGTTALLYTIFYYKVEITKNKLINNRLGKQVDELKMNLQSLMKDKYKEI